MAPAQAPPIEPRTYVDLVAELDTLAEEYTAGDDGPGWQAPEPGGALDAGAALIRIFSRLAEIAIARINQIPERNYLAFLDLIGTRPAPPQPARVPLTFHLAAGSQTDAFVPARTQVAAAPLEGDTGPVLFETERSLVVTRSQLAAAWTREPGRDLYRDATAIVLGLTEGTFPPFRGDQPVQHALYLGHRRLLESDEPKRVTIQIVTAQSNFPWFANLDWESWDGTTWQPLSPSALSNSGYVSEVTFNQVPAIPPSVVAGETRSWIRARLNVPLPHGQIYFTGMTSRVLNRDGLVPVAMGLDGDGLQPLDATGTVYPLGRSTPLDAFYFAAPEAFDRAGTGITLDVQLDPARLPQPSAGLQLALEYQDQSDMWKWKPVPATFIPEDSTAEGPFAAPFLASGRISFLAPAGWGAQPLGGVKARWLRLRVVQGDFHGMGDFRPPVVSRLRVSYSWPLPYVTDLRLIVEIDRTDPQAAVPPDLGFTNQVPADLSKDFLPFGEKPKLGDTFYLAAETVLSRPSAHVFLDIEPTVTASERPPLSAKPSDDLVLTWEFWDGRRWQLLGRSGPGYDASGKNDPGPYQLKDTTQGLSRTGTVDFYVPSRVQPVEVNGEKKTWIRVRITAGNYGFEASYRQIGEDPETHQPRYQLQPADFRPPLLRSLLLRYLFLDDSTYWESVIAENDFRYQTDLLIDGMSYSFEPFVPVPDAEPTLYLGFDRPGDLIGFANRAVTLYFGVAGALYDPATEQKGTLEDPQLAWEYWNGTRWQRLGARDETAGFTRRGLVTFIGPADFVSSTEFGRLAFWLRVRWEGGGYAVEPELRRILTNTTWAVHARTFEDEVLGSSRGEPGQSFRTAQSPLLGGPRLEVVEPEVPSALDRDDIEAEEGLDAIRPVLDAAGRATEVRVRWHEVRDFYGSGPRSRHYTLDLSTGEVRFGDGRHGLIPPLGRNNLRLSYRSGGGLEGNRPAGNITQLRGTVPYVDSVLQYEAAEGGAAEEALAEITARGPLKLRHRDRAVAPADFEDLAFEASTEVARARCVPARDGADAGTVGLIVVPRSAAAKPVPAVELLGRVRAYLEARLSPVLDLWIVGPDWLEVSVTVEIVPRVLEGANDVQNAVLDRLSSFLHPLTGGLDGEGWAFGRKPYRSDLYALIEGTPGVDHVRRLQVAELPREGGARPDRFLVYSGEHQITVTGNTDESATDGSLG